RGGPRRPTDDGEVRHLLRTAVLEDLEVVLVQTEYGIAALVRDRDIDVDDMDLDLSGQRRKRSDILRRGGRRQGRGKQRKRQYTHGGFPQETTILELNELLRHAERLTDLVTDGHHHP